MATDKQRAEYLAKSEEAEAKAAMVTDSDARDTWLRIAKNYRELAAYRPYPGR